MSSGADRNAVFPPDTLTPYVAAVVHALLLPISVYWCVVCGRRARSGPAGNRLLGFQAVSWAIGAVDQATLLVYSLLLMRCPAPYMYLRPAILGGRCPAAVAYAASDVCAVLSTPLFLATSIGRFLLTFEALSERRSTIFLRVSYAVVAAAVFGKLVILGQFLPEANVYSIDPMASGSTPAQQAMILSEMPFYALMGILDMASVFLGVRFIYGVLTEARRAFQPLWTANPPPAALVMKARERRHLFTALAMLAGNVVMIGAFAIVSLGIVDAWNDLSLVEQNVVFAVLVRAFGSFEMLAVDYIGKAVACNQLAAELLTARGKTSTGTAAGAGNSGLLSPLKSGATASEQSHGHAQVSSNEHLQPGKPYRPRRDNKLD